MLFSIIIPNYNKADNIQALLSSIYSNYPFDDFEVLFMDDASTDSSIAAAQQFPVRLYAVKTKAGPATLRNMAAKEACGEYLLFFDSDVILTSETLMNFRDLCLTRKFSAVAGLEVLPPVIDNWIGNYRTLQIQDQCGEYRTKEGRVRSWGTTFGAIRRDLFLSMGGFNESYKGADVEDHAFAAHIDGTQIILFAPQLTYRHTYTGAVDLLTKQFRRASQMVRIKQNVLFNHSFFGWRFKISHLLVVLALAGSIACLFDKRWIIAVTVALLLKAATNWYLLRQALKRKGFVFAAYCFATTLIMSLCIIAGAFYGTLKRVK